MGQTEFEKAFSDVSANHAAQSSITLLLKNFVVPACLALLGIVTPKLWDYDKGVAIVCWLILLAVYALLSFKSSPQYKDVYDLLSKKLSDEKIILELRSKSEELEFDVFKLQIKNILCFALRAMSVQYVEDLKVNGSVANLREMLDEIVSPVYLQGDILFGFEMSERWSVSIYLWDEQANILRPVWRKTSPSHPSATLGREWLAGEGHVGKAFLDRRSILTGDANEDAVAKLCRPRNSKQRETDSDLYVSFASVPISLEDDDNANPYGVLVATSDFKDRFSEESSTELLMHFAETIALILRFSGVSLSCVLAACSATTTSTPGEGHGESAEAANEKGFRENG